MISDDLSAFSAVAVDVGALGAVALGAVAVSPVLWLMLLCTIVM